MYPHRIHLRGPWDARPLARTRLRRDGSLEEVEGPVPAALKMMLPCRWEQGGLGPFPGRVRFRRGFSWPKELASYERLWLVIGAADYFARATLNDQLLGEHAGAFEPFEYEITALVKQRNELVIDVDCPVADPVAQRDWLWRGRLGPGGGLWGTVALEVRRESFLRLERIAAKWNGGRAGLGIRGEIHAEQDQKFDLSVRLGDRELIYRPSSPGNFELTLPAGAVRPWRPLGLGEPWLYELQIQLNDAACQLDQRLFTIGFRAETTPADAATLPWTQPLTELTILDQADREGRAVKLELPVRPAAVENDARRAAAEALKRRLTHGVAYHPSVTIDE